MTTAKLTSKGQITVPSDVRKRLGLDSGDRVEFVEIEQGLFTIKPVTGDVRALKGLLKKPAKRVSIEDMNAAIRARATRRDVADIVRRLLGIRQLAVQEAETVWRALRLFESSKADFSDCLIMLAAKSEGCERAMTFDKQAAFAGMTLLV